MSANLSRIPVIDLFAGPGGLGEGFSAYKIANTQPFEIKLSIENDPTAHQTLQLRSFYRQFTQNEVPDAYYDYLRENDVPEYERRNKLFRLYPDQAKQAQREARLAELGIVDRSTVNKWIQDALGGYGEWVLLGGPPCQAYSIVGRSRNRGNENYRAEKDHRQYLYLEYLQIIAEHQPAIFVMENVKGLLSATLKNQWIFSRMYEDLQEPRNALKREHRDVQAPVCSEKPCSYKLYSLIKPGQVNIRNLSDFVVYMEYFGIPQARHRVVVLGIREDIDVGPKTLKPRSTIAASKVLSGLPKVRSGLSREEDNAESWRNWVQKIAEYPWFTGLQKQGTAGFHDKLVARLKEIRHEVSRGGEFVSWEPGIGYHPKWYLDSRIGGVCNHITRGHIVGDLHRYFYAACFAEVEGQSPKLKDFPMDLLPAHRNAERAMNGNSLFVDRFRVQIDNRPATTITAHISKDGHYYIHPDPTQCRSLTVREAARLQTFPDNYFFCGPRTSQYVQVGNAVPPLLAKQIAGIVHNLLKQASVTR
ncbi:MAG: DNA cytosine methyltransferase [Gemmatimonadota bacterium]|nr:DNA cytosine methyltransferase [Gemmatimonadota bacterium]